VSPRVKVTTHTQTRLAAVSFHSKRFLELAGVSRARASTMSRAIEQRWLSSVGVYGYNGAGQRVLEQEFAIDWGQHDRLTTETPTIDASLPGWEDDLAVEVTAACERFRNTVETLKLSISFWVIFVPEIRANAELHRTRCKELGLSFGGKTPAWAGKYSEFSVSVSGLEEATIRMRVYEE
jgi:hypothetical protein